MSNLVSILIPAYNAEKWIKYTIESALSQTWGRKEIIIVDDGSTDKTLQVAREYESRAVKVVTQENRGASAARNRALEYAQGDYIQWLDADDLLAPNKISEQMKYSENGGKSLKLFSSPHGIFYWRIEKANFVPNSLWQNLTPLDYMMKHCSENAWMNPAGWLVSRRITEKAGPWDERLSLDDDGEYFSRVAIASEHIRFVPDAKCYYRQSGVAQLSRTNSDKACRSLLLSLTLCIQYLRAMEESERTRRAGLNFLQYYQIYFYFAENAELSEKMRILVHELGGELMPPKLNMKEGLMCKLFGVNRGMQFMSVLRKLKFGIMIKWDELLYIITSPSGMESKL